jgi:hypothetical protein
MVLLTSALVEIILPHDTRMCFQSLALVTSFDLLVDLPHSMPLNSQSICSDGPRSPLMQNNRPVTLLQYCMKLAIEVGMTQSDVQIVPSYP